MRSPATSTTTVMGTGAGTGNITPMMLNSPPRAAGAAAAAAKQTSFHVSRRSLSGSISQVLGRSTNHDGAPSASGGQLIFQSQPPPQTQAQAQGQVPPAQVQDFSRTEPQALAAQQTKEASSPPPIHDPIRIPNEVPPLPISASVAPSLSQPGNNDTISASSANANANSTRSTSTSTSSQQSNNGILTPSRQSSATSPVKDHRPPPWPSPPPPVRRLPTGIPLQRPLSRATNNVNDTNANNATTAGANAPGLVGGADAADDYHHGEEPASMSRSPQVSAARRMSGTPLLRPRRSQSQSQSQTQGSSSPDLAPTPTCLPSSSADVSTSGTGGETAAVVPASNTTIAPAIAAESISVESIEEEIQIPIPISPSPEQISEPLTPTASAENEHPVPAPIRTAGENLDPASAVREQHETAPTRDTPPPEEDAIEHHHYHLRVDDGGGLVAEVVIPDPVTAPQTEEEVKEPVDHDNSCDITSSTSHTQIKIIPFSLMKLLTPATQELEPSIDEFPEEHDTAAEAATHEPEAADPAGEGSHLLPVERYEEPAEPVLAFSPAAESLGGECASMGQSVLRESAAEDMVAATIIAGVEESAPKPNLKPAEVLFVIGPSNCPLHRW